jgi:hypothetical protein
MPISLPKEIQELVNSALAEVNSDPLHRLAPQRRQQIYVAFKANANPVGRRACGWLAVITAKKVLPLFQQEFPEDKLPQDLIDTAIGVMQGRVDDATADDILDEGYHASGNAWGYDETEITWNADLGGSAAYHALKEARGQEPFDNLEREYKLGVVSVPSREWVDKYPQPTKGDQFTDEDLCQTENSDTAAVAAVAFACQPDGPLCDPSKLQEFWTWWLTAAIPEAWKTAQQ